MKMNKLKINNYQNNKFTAATSTFQQLVIIKK